MKTILILACLGVLIACSHQAPQRSAASDGSEIGNRPDSTKRGPFSLATAYELTCSDGPGCALGVLSSDGSNISGYLDIHIEGCNASTASALTLLAKGEINTKTGEANLKFEKVPWRGLIFKVNPPDKQSYMELKYFKDGVVTAVFESHCSLKPIY